jgi:hypothetical protein
MSLLDPLQGGGELLVVIHHQNGFQFDSVDVRLNFVRLRLKTHRYEHLVQQS